MSVRLPSGVLTQFATNLGLIDNANTRDGTLRPSKYRFELDKEPDSGIDGKFFVSMERMTQRDPHWGTRENFINSIVSVRVGYYRGGGDAGGGDRQTVMRDAADDAQVIGDVCENPANYNPNVTGIRTIRCTGTQKVLDRDKAEIWETTFEVQHESDLATSPVITPSEGGVTLLPIQGSFASEGVADQEDVVTPPLVVDFDDFGFDSVRVRLLAFAKTDGGTATFQVRLGGTKGAADGTVVASMTTDGASFDLTTAVGGAFGKPSGLQLLQVTMECDDDEICYLDGIGVAILDGDA